MAPDLRIEPGDIAGWPILKIDYPTDPKRLAVLATSLEDNAPQPQLWTLERGTARVFGCIPGHYMWTHDDPLYRLLVLRGIAWAARDPDVERLSELALIGARLAP